MEAEEPRQHGTDYESIEAHWARTDEKYIQLKIHLHDGGVWIRGDPGVDQTDQLELAYCFWKILRTSGIVPDRFDDPSQILSVCRDTFKPIESPDIFHDRCLCGKQLHKYNHIVQAPNGAQFMIGSSCIKRFMGGRLHEALRDGRFCFKHNQKIDRRKAHGKTGLCDQCHHEELYTQCSECAVEMERPVSGVATCTECQHGPCPGCATRMHRSFNACYKCNTRVISSGKDIGSFLEVYQNNKSMTNWLMRRDPAFGWVQKFQSHYHDMRSVLG